MKDTNNNSGEYVQDSLNTFNQDNLADFSWRTDGENRRQKDKDIIYENMSKTDWSKESLYHNTYRINGKNTTRTIKMSNRDWHKLNQI